MTWHILFMIIYYSLINSTRYIFCHKFDFSLHQKDTVHKGSFQLCKMNGKFTAKYIWAYAMTFFYSLFGEIFLFKIIKRNLSYLRQKINCPQLLDQSTQIINFVSKDIAIRSNRERLLIIWEVSTYLQIYFHFHCHCSRIT